MPLGHIRLIGWTNRDVTDRFALCDPARIAFVDGHYRAAVRRLPRANVQGFFNWSLLNNHERAFGHEKRFGLIHVDFQTLKRTPKASYHALAVAIAR